MVVKGRILSMEQVRVVGNGRQAEGRQRTGMGHCSAGGVKFSVCSVVKAQNVNQSGSRNEPQRQVVVGRERVWQVGRLQPAQRWWCGSNYNRQNGRHGIRVGRQEGRNEERQHVRVVVESGEGKVAKWSCVWWLSSIGRWWQQCLSSPCR